MHLVGDIAAGLPSLGLPDVGWAEISTLIPGAIGVAVVVFGLALGWL